MARRAVRMAADRIEAARQEQAAAEVEQLEASARSRISAFEVAAERDLKVMTVKVRALIKLWVEAHLAREAAIRAGADEDALPLVEGFRAHAGLPERVLKVDRVTRWINPSSGSALSDEQTARVRDHGSTAILLRTDGGQSIQLTDKAEYERTVYVERQPATRIVSLPEALAIPALMAPGTPGWDGQGVRSPRAVLERLQQLEEAAPPDLSDRRERMVKLHRITNLSPSALTP